MARTLTAFVALCAALVALQPAVVRADAALFSRFENLATASFGAGTKYDFGHGDQVLGLLDVRFRLIDSFGLLANYETSIAATHRFATGLELRPLFLLRLVSNHSTGLRGVDFALDSLGVEAGGILGETAHASDRRVFVGGGFDVPLTVNTASGPIMRAAYRYQPTTSRSALAQSSDHALLLILTYRFAMKAQPSGLLE